MSATINLPKFMDYYITERGWKYWDIGLLKPAPMKYHVDYYYFHKSDLLIERLKEAYDFISKHYEKDKIYERNFKHIIIMTKGNPTINTFLEFTKSYKFPFKTLPF